MREEEREGGKGKGEGEGEGGEGREVDRLSGCKSLRTTASKSCLCPHLAVGGLSCGVLKVVDQ